MEEDDCDYHTPIGQVIKHINFLCKKPPFDNQLNEAINLFYEKLYEQEKYLVNGIFKINFAESALFLQSCAELYAKKIDLLWNELLEFHTRLIKYDYEHQKEKGGPINKEAIEKLEERRNRHLRKKKFKLIQEEVVVTLPQQATVAPPENDDVVKVDYNYLICDDIYDIADESEEFDSAAELWDAINLETKDILKYPPLVYKQMTRTYRLKNYFVLSCQDYDILDEEDGEFNTKYSRVPGWHHMLHLVEYNDKGLLPDNKQLIAKLKLSLVNKQKFMLENKITFDVPYEKYKDNFLAYCKRFFKEEAEKWQNMPLDTLEDLRNQYNFLARMSEKNDQISRYTVKTRCSQDDKIEILDTSDEDSLFETNLDSNQNAVNSELFVRLEKLSSDVINTKFRQDSGIYDCNLAQDDETTMEEFVGVSDATNVEESSTENLNITDGNADNSAEATVADNSDVTNNNPEITGEDDNFDTRSFISDHDYCVMSSNNNVADDSITDENKSLNETMEEIFRKPLERVKVLNKRQVVREYDDCDSPPKRRKLSQKQIEALLKSKIAPVNLLRFEKFFSENYQPQDGEGEVPTVDYDPKESDTDNPNEVVTTVENTDDSPDQDDDLRSIHSDHSYCRTQSENPHNDSGFLDGVNPATQVSTVNENQVEQLIQPNTQKETADEYEKLLIALHTNGTEPSEKLLKEIRAKAESRARVEEWRDTINPILSNLKESDFDIHEYGSRIIEGMELNESKPFNNIVQGKSSAEVVRYFISSLQLANTNNIEICGAKQGQLSNDTFEVKLISKDRYHEHLSEYLAPSEETLAEKLARVRAMDENQDKVNTTKGKQLKLMDKKSRSNQSVSVKKISVKITRLQENYLPERQHTETANTYQSNKENCNNRLTSDESGKGKSIIKRQLNTPHILNYDISLPSTSRNMYHSEISSSSSTSVFNPQMPSTSAQNLSPLRQGDSDMDIRRPPNISSNKRKFSDTSEESFNEGLTFVRKMNPDIQVHSTPTAPVSIKRVKISSDLKKSILF